MDEFHLLCELRCVPIGLSYRQIFYCSNDMYKEAHHYVLPYVFVNRKPHDMSLNSGNIYERIYLYFENTTLCSGLYHIGESFPTTRTHMGPLTSMRSYVI